MIVTTYHEKPLIFSRVTFREKPVSHHQAMTKGVSFLFIAKVGSEGVKLTGPARKFGVFWPSIPKTFGVKIAFSATFAVIQPDFWD